MENECLQNKTPRGRRSNGGPFDDGASDEGSEASSISSAGGGTGGTGGSGGVSRTNNVMKPRYNLQSPNNGSSSTRSSYERGVAGGGSGSGGKFSLAGMGSSSGAGGGGIRRGQVGDDSENLNPEDIHRSLRSTANAIQNYSFDYSPARFGGLDETRMGKMDLLDASKGSPTLEEKMSLMEISASPVSSRISPDKSAENSLSLSSKKSSSSRGKKSDIQWTPLIVATSGPALSGHNNRWHLYPAVF